MVQTRSRGARNQLPLPTRQLRQVLVPRRPSSRESSPPVSTEKGAATELVEPKAPVVSKSEVSTSEVHLGHAMPLLSAKTLPTSPSTVISPPRGITPPINELVSTFSEPLVALAFQDQVVYAKLSHPAKTLRTTVLNSQVEHITPTLSTVPTFSAPPSTLPPRNQTTHAKPLPPTKRLPPLISRFLQLPVELRTRIYVLVLTTPSPIQITHHPRPPPLHSPTAHHHPTFLAATSPHYRLRLGGTSALSLAFTCRQTYHESTRLYYALNTFQYTSYGPLRHHFHEWLRAIGPGNRNLVHHILFVVDGDCSALVDLGHLPALRCLTIVLAWPADRCKCSGVPKEALMGLARMSRTLERVGLRYGGPVRGSEGNVAVGLNERDVEEVNEVLGVERGKGGRSGGGVG